jgi:hypothetical protein
MYKLLAFSWLLFLFGCPKNNNIEQRNRENQFILNYLRNQNSSSNPLDITCNNFANTESTCVIASDANSSTCQASEYSRLKSNITPETKRTDQILIAFYNCWRNCLNIYIASDRICSSSKYNTTKLFRDQVKSANNQPSVVWGTCMNSCNNGKSESEGLKGESVTYQGQPY